MYKYSALLLAFIFILLAFGCFGSRDRSKEIDSGFREAETIVETGGISDGVAPRAGSIAFDGGFAGVGASNIALIDATLMDAIVQGGTGNVFITGATGGQDITYIEYDDGGVSDAPCSPNCPALIWVTIQGGTFMMGSAGSSDVIGSERERPQHEVTIQSFKMLKSHVTVAQYRRCVDSGVCSEPYVQIDPYDTYGRFNWVAPGRENHPVNSVNWYQAREFAEWIGGRLPSEAEWEYAARNRGQDVTWPWGNEEAGCEYLVENFDDVMGVSCGIAGTMEVCSKPLGSTVQGLCDMAGSVREWIEDDAHYNYYGAPIDGSAWVDEPRASSRVDRGGAWNFALNLNRSAYRGASRPDETNDMGFRAARDL